MDTAFLAKDSKMSQWTTLAEEAIRMAEYEESQGRYGGTYRNRAATYARAAEAEEISKTTGYPVCVCCLKPLGQTLLNWQKKIAATSIFTNGS